MHPHGFALTADTKEMAKAFANARAAVQKLAKTVKPSPYALNRHERRKAKGRK